MCFCGTSNFSWNLETYIMADIIKYMIVLTIHREENNSGVGLSPFIDLVDLVCRYITFRPSKLLNGAE